jgi:hypothetical protein
MTPEQRNRAALYSYQRQRKAGIAYPQIPKSLTHKLEGEKEEVRVEDDKAKDPWQGQVGGKE